MQNISTNKFSDFKLYTLKEKDFFKIINTLLSKIICIPECFHYYLIQEKNNNIGKLLLDSTKEFYTLYEKKIAKIIMNTRLEPTRSESCSCSRIVRVSNFSLGG